MAIIKSTRILNLQAGLPRVVPIPLDASTPISGASPGGATVGAVSATAATANTNANTALTATSGFAGSLANKLEAGYSYVMAGVMTLSDVSYGIKTAGFDGGNGLALTGNGIVMRQGGVTKVSIPATGDPTFAGTLDCGNGAVIRTPDLAAYPGSIELIKLQLANGNQFGKLVQYSDTLNAGVYNPGIGWEFNFSGSGRALIGITDTTSGWATRLSLTATGNISQYSLLNGVVQYGSDIAKCNGQLQGGLNAHMLDGYGAASFSQTSHTHSGYASAWHDHGATYAAASHNHVYNILSTFYADVYAADGATFVATYQIRVRGASPVTWWGFATY